MQYIYIRKPDLRYSFDVSTWVGKPFATDFFSQQKNRNYAKLYCREIFPAGRHRTQRRLIVTEPVIFCLYMLRSINYTAAIEAHHNKRTIINYISSIPSLCYCEEFSKETFRQPALSRVNDDKKKRKEKDRRLSAQVKMYRSYLYLTRLAASSFPPFTLSSVWLWCRADHCNCLSATADNIEFCRVSEQIWWMAMGKTCTPWPCKPHHTHHSKQQKLIDMMTQAKNGCGQNRRKLKKKTKNGKSPYPRLVHFFVCRWTACCCAMCITSLDDRADRHRTPFVCAIGASGEKSGVFFCHSIKHVFFSRFSLHINWSFWLNYVRLASFLCSVFCVFYSISGHNHVWQSSQKKAHEMATPQHYPHVPIQPFNRFNKRVY